MKEYRMAYGLDGSMHAVDGLLTMDEAGLITARADGEVQLTLQAQEVEEALVLPGVGCGLLFVKKKDGEEQVLCRFTMSTLKQAGEFCKVVNYYVQTGIAAFGDEQPKPVCEKCGKPLIEGMSVCLFCYDKMGVIKRALKLMRPFAKQLIPAEILITLHSILYLLLPRFQGYLIDNHLQPKVGPVTVIIAIAGGMMLTRVCSDLFYIIGSRIFNKGSILFANHLRDMAYAKIQKLSLQSLAKRTPGDLIRRVMEDTALVKDFLGDHGRWAIEQVVLFFVVIVILLFIDPKLTLFVVLPIPIVAFALTRFWGFIHIRFERQWRKNSKCQSILHDIIKGIRTVKSFGNEDLEIAKFSEATRELAVVSSSNEVMWALLFPAITFFTGIGEFLILYFCGREVIAGTQSLGVLVQFTMYLGYIYSPLRWLVSFPRWLADALTSMVKMFEILDDELDIAETEDSLIIPVTGGVDFDSVSFGYKSYEPVLKDINVSIKPGEMIGIVGRSGAGKSTMINLIMRLYDPNNGKIDINDTNIRDISPRHLHESIGVVFQDTFLFAGTLYDNVAYAKPDATPDEVIAACKAANAHEFIMKTPDGYDTLIGESGHSISGGERQRLAIARAIIKNPDILILDEATSSLDVETESSIQESLNRLTQNRTTIAIAHRLSTLRSADRLIVLDKGKIAEVGTHAELLKSRGIYYNLVMAQRQTSKVAEG